MPKNIGVADAGYAKNLESIHIGPQIEAKVRFGMIIIIIATIISCCFCCYCILKNRGKWFKKKASHSDHRQRTIPNDSIQDQEMYEMDGSVGMSKV